MKNLSAVSKFYILTIMAATLAVVGYVTSDKDKYPKASKYAKAEMIIGLIVFGFCIGLFTARYKISQFKSVVN